MRVIACTAIVMTVLVQGCQRDPKEALAHAVELERQAVAVADSLRQPERVGELFAPVLKAYAEIIDGEPGTEYAEQALFNTAAIYNNSTREFGKAVEAYKRYAKEYPAGKKCAVAMFLTGYIYNNELGNLDSARAAYHRFLEQFPDHEMAASAQFELNTLGRTPEQILPPAEPPAEQKVAAKRNPRS